jgi:hypothetical protein
MRSRISHLLFGTMSGSRRAAYQCRARDGDGVVEAERLQGRRGMMSLWGPCALAVFAMAGNACRLKLCLVTYSLQVSRRTRVSATLPSPLPPLPCRHLYRLRNLTLALTLALALALAPAPIPAPTHSPQPCSDARLHCRPSNPPWGPFYPAPGSARPRCPMHRRRACG